MDDETVKRLSSVTVSPHHPWWEQQYRSESMADVMRLLADREEIAYQLYGGTDPDGPVQGLDGLDLSSVANVLHSMAVRSEVLEHAIKAHRAVVSAGRSNQAIAEADEALYAVLDDA